MATLVSMYDHKYCVINDYQYHFIAIGQLQTTYQHIAIAMLSFGMNM